VITAHKLTLLCDALRKLAAELAADDAFRDPDRGQQAPDIPPPDR
jgi:hypothetical protein